MACIQPYWSCLQLGSQHLARQFAGHGWQVHYFAAPVTPLHLMKIKSPEVSARFKASLQSPLIHQDNIRSYIPFSMLAPDGMPLLRSRQVVANWHKSVFPTLKTIIKHSGLDQVDLLYIDNLSYHFLLDQLDHDRCLFRVMDIHEHFPGWTGHCRWMAQKIASKADVTIYSARGLKEYVESLSPRKTSLVPNGVDYWFFRSQGGAGGRHPVLSKVPDPVVLYTGILDSRLDWRLIQEAAAALPGVFFVFAGPGRPGPAVDRLPGNIYITGPVPHGELPWLMRSAVAGIIPFDVDNRLELIQGIRPLKLLEYMAAGLPVICARWPEVENMNSPAWIYDSEQDFVHLVSKAASLTHDPQPYQNFAARHDWSASFRMLQSGLGL